jgi:hypothetical protein
MADALTHGPTLSRIGTMGLLTLLALLAGGSPTSWSRTLTAADGPMDDLTVVLPFYEGVRLDAAPATLLAIGQHHLRLAYPGVLSAPFVAWRFGAGPWEVARVEEAGASPAEVELQPSPGSLQVAVRSLGGRAVRTARFEGDLGALARGLRGSWKVVGAGHPLAERFRRQHFYVHQHVPNRSKPGSSVRLDWELPALVEQMRHESPDTIQFVYGFDPSGIDLAGEYFWSEGALDRVRQVLGANRRLAHLNWLNLRTWKVGIPGLGITRPITREVQAMLKVYPGGTERGKQFAFEALDACLASAQWQRSRLTQLDRLADLGFAVVQVDEFPIPRFWHTAACQSAEHLHRPGDIADEWRQIDLFLGKLAARARQRRVLLTCEEPSMVMLPHVAGYIDRQFNDEIDLYKIFRKSPRAAPIPFFSMMFGELATPYTDTDQATPARRPPSGWIEQDKISPPPKGPR